MMRLKSISILWVGIWVVSCMAGKDNFKNATTLLAFQEEMTEGAEAVVWLRNPDGQVTSHWVKNDVAGAVVVASRPDAVLPVGGALWRFPNEDTLDDYDTLVLENLVTQEQIEIPLDPDVQESEENEDDEEADAGLEPSSLSNDESDEETCRIQRMQSLPILLGAMGSYLFITYEEKQYDCNEVLLRTDDRYLCYDLAVFEEVNILLEEEIELLLERPEVKKLGRYAEYVGSAPLYDGLSTARLSHVFASREEIVQENGDHHWLVDMVEILDEKAPQSLKGLEVAPPLVQAFTVIYSNSIPAGWWVIQDTPEIALKMLSAFTK